MTRLSNGVGRVGVLVLALVASPVHIGSLESQQPVQRSGPGSKDLTDQIRRIGHRTGGLLTLAALHLESGEALSVDDTTPVFMSSVVKLPLAVQVLARADRGALRLDDTIAIAALDLSPGHSPLAESYPAGSTFAVRELVRRAVSESDNTANDALLRYSGGPKRATTELHRLGVRGIRIDRYYTGYSADYVGAKIPPRDRWSRALFDTLGRSLPDERRDAAARRFQSDSRDRTSASAMVALLARLHRGALLGRESTALLLRYMTESRNPATRLTAGVPAGTRVAHKTGTWGGWRGTHVAVNDVGIITLPDGAGHLAVAILVRGATRPVTEVDSAIAEATRLLYERWSRVRPRG